MGFAVQSKDYGMGELFVKVISYIEKDRESGMFIATVPSIPGAHTQAKSLDEIQKNINEVVALCLGEMSSDEKKQIPEFVGILQVEIY